jgi:hypothetical protein
VQAGFDPYREWLEIPDATETPNHYRLLGLRLFEDDPQRIEAAVARVGKVLSRKLTGSHRSEAKRLLSELDLARGCLTDAAAKQQYDQLLKAELLGEPIAPKATFVSQAQTSPLLPPGQPAMSTPLRSTINVAPVHGLPLPPGMSVDPTAGQSGIAGAPQEPAMRVNVQPIAAPLTPPSSAAPSAPAALPPSAFAGDKSSRGAAPPAVDNADDMLPPAALPASFATPPAAQPMPSAPAAYSVPMAAPAQPYAQPAYAQPLQAHPIYPTAQPMAAMPLPQAGMHGVPQAVPFAAQAPVYAMPAQQSQPEPSSPDAMSMDDTPVVSTARRSWRSRSSSPVALYLALPVGALLVLAAVMVYNYQTRQQNAPSVPVAQNPAGAGHAEPSANDSSVAALPAGTRNWQDVRQPPAGSDAADAGAARAADRQPGSPAMAARVEPVSPITPTVEPEKPAVDQEKTDATIRQTLDEVRQALRQRKFDLAKAKIQSARKSSGGSSLAAEVQRVDALVQYVEGFWHGVDEQIKGLTVGDQTMLRDVTVGVVDKDAEKLVLRVNGENRTYARDDLPIGVAIGLAEAWFDAADPASKIFLGSIHVVHPKGDRDKARQLWQEAAQGGKGQEVALVLPELDKPFPGSAAPAESEMASRLPPKPAELSAAKTEVRQMFEADLADASEEAAKVAVAEKMLRRADEGSDTAAIRFTLLSEAARLAAQGGDFEQMSAALARQAELFEIDAVDVKSDVLFDASKSTEGADGNQALARTALAAYDEAVLLEQFDQASKLARIALTSARKGGDSELIKECSAREKEARELNKK